MTPAPTANVITRQTIVAIALVALAVLIWSISEVLVIAFGAVVLATVLRAMVGPLHRATGCPERVSLAIVVLGLLIVFSLMFWLFGRQATQQFADMQEQLPQAFEKMREWLERSQVGRLLVNGLQKMSESGGPLANAASAVATALGGIGYLLLIAFAAIYLAADPRMYRHGALRLLPPSRRAQVGRALDDAGGALHQWLVAQIIVMVAVGVLTGVGLALLGVPLWLSLGLLAGVLEFVPVVGPIVAAIPGVLLAFSKGPDTAFYVLLVYIAVQQIESNVLTPLVQRWAVELPPVVALLSIAACGLLFGVLGVLFATPMAVVVMAMVKHLYVEDTLEKGRPANETRRARGKAEV